MDQELKEYLEEMKASIVKDVEAVIARQEATMDGLLSTVARQEATMDGLLSTVARQETTMDGLLSTVARQETTMDGLLSTVARQETTMDGLLSTVARQETTMEDLKASVGTQAVGLEDLKAKMEERFRHVEILIEGVHHEVRLVAEGVGGANEKLAAFQADTAHRIEEVQSSFEPYFRNVNGRLSHLEDKVPALDRRVTALESRPPRRAVKKPPTQ